MKYFVFCLPFLVSSIAYADVAPEPEDAPEPSTENPDDSASDDSEKEESEEDAGCSTVSSSYFAGTMLPVILLGGVLVLRNRDSTHQ